MADTAKKESKKERAIAAWESAVARTLNPHLTDAQAEAVWAAVVENREDPNAAKFAESLNAVLDGAPTPIRLAAGSLVTNLESVLKITN